MKHPIVLVPGLQSSRFYVKFDKGKAPSDECVPYEQSTDQSLLYWVNWSQLTPQAIACYMDNLRLCYNQTTRRTSNKQGVSLSVHEFGNTTCVESLDGDPNTPAQVFTAIVDALVRRGYTRGVDVRGAPYDWRIAPNEMQAFYTQLTELVQDTYAINANTKVILVSHSMGSPIVLVSAVNIYMARSHNIIKGPKKRS